MKHHMRRVILACLSILMAVNIFVYYSLTVYAFPKRLLDGTWIDVPLSEYGEEISYFIQYAVNQMGAVFTRDFETWLKNNDTYKDLYDDNGRLAKNVSIDTQTGTVTYNKEIMIVLKNAVDDYAKQEQTKEENGGFYLLPTTKYDDVPISNFYNGAQYRTFRNIVLEKGVLPVRTYYRYNISFVDPFSDPDHPIVLIATLDSLNEYIKDPEKTVRCNFYCLNDWEYETQPVLSFPAMSEEYFSCSDASQYNTGAEGYSNVADINTKEINKTHFVLYSTTGERVRVFVSQYAAQNYSVGNRKIYFTENYYNYVPEDLTVSIDDLQKSVDDLQKIIDELLKKINDQTSEKEIEELLRLILEELRNNPGGGGSGSGSGDVTVSVDLKETNSWLSKIYTKVSQIFDEMQKGFEDVVEQLKKIKNWSAVDTVIDGVDAVADWLDLIHDVLTDGAGSAVSALSSALQDSTDLMKQKFPFSIPWDILFFVSVLSAEPETPQFSIPFNFEFPALDLSVDYEMELDFTPLQWLSDLSRLLLSLTYAAGLMKKTVDIVSANKEG